jgi:CheY-like chemotaxis protein/HPt (histidine-containing phosphotransfer) domain-containing protein
MNAIIGMTHLALGTELDAQQRDYLDKVRDAATMLLGVLNDILDFSKIEAGKLTLESVPCRIEEVAGRALMLLRERAHHKELELLCDVEDAALLAEAGCFLGDPLRLGQVLVNLLSNAVKFTERGHVRLSVGLEGHDGAGLGAQATLKLAVQDTGVGMTPIQVGRLFQEFTQADGSTTRRYGGTGLGLSISRRLVELMGGTLVARSEVGIGSTFTVSLPVRLAPVAVSTRQAALGPLRVLVVDDQRESRHSLVGQLRALGVGSADGGVVEATGSGAEAVARCEAARRVGHGFDLVLLDWVLPDMDGGQVARQLCATAGPRPRVVVVSAYGWDNLRRDAQAAGAEGYLAKPILPEALRRVLLPGTAVVAARADAVQTLRGLRVLLVEDNPINRQLASELLARAGASVDLAVHGREAIERLESNGPQAYDLVLMDLQMPVMDGYEATRAIRARPEWNPLPIVAMTAHAMVEERDRCLALGMRGHIAKPLDPVALVRELAAYVPAEPGPTPATALPPVLPRSPTEQRLPWPAWPGIDLPAALAHCGGDTLLRNGLAAFAAQYADHETTLRVLAAQDRRGDLAREAHTLKGLGRQFGMHAVAVAAVALESALHANREGPIASVEGLAEAIAAVVRELAAAPPWPQPATTGGAAVASPVVVSHEGWAELRRLLVDADSEALVRWQTLREALMAALPEPAARALDHAVQGCDFDAALALLPAAAADGDGSPDVAA